MKKLINEIKELHVAIKIGLTMLLGGTASMPIRYHRGEFGIGTMWTNVIVLLILMFYVIKLFPGEEREQKKPSLVTVFFTSRKFSVPFSL